MAAATGGGGGDGGGGDGGGGASLSIPAAVQPVPPLVGASVKVSAKDIAGVFRGDEDDSGDIDVAELRIALNDLGVPVDTAAAADVLSQFDADQSGRLDLDEFRKLVLSWQFQDSAANDRRRSHSHTSHNYARSYCLLS